MNADDAVKQAKILYIVPEDQDDAGESESLWSHSLGDQLYELQNIPFYAEHLNLEDIVRCDESVDGLPVIQELVRRSGNRTLRVIFREEAPEEICVDILWELGKQKIFSEKVTDRRFMFNVPPTSDYARA